jgi:7,8-dihydro-6-hydroxymethylpterin-pyrophosphokinase
MNNPETYSWQQDYLAAVLETDNDLMPLRIYEALAAIEQRLLSPIEGIEQRTIDEAQTGLLTLKAERVEEGTRIIREGRLSEETC